MSFIGQQYNFIDEHKLKSDLNAVDNYQTFASGNKTFLIGTGNTSGKGYITASAGKSLNAVSIAVMDENGNISPFKTIEKKEFQQKLETNGSKSNMRFVEGPKFTSIKTLENGNVFIFGRSEGWHHGMLISSTGELIKYYIFQHGDPKKVHFFTTQLEVRNNKVYVVLAEQPNALGNDIRTDFYVSSIVVVTTKKQLFELFHKSQLFTIDGNNGSITKVQADKVIKDFHTMGNNPVIFAENGIIIPGRIKANDGKKVSLIKINY